MHRNVSETQRQRARALRTDMTVAEQRLWRLLRGHRLHGVGFRRQAPIGTFIVDFVCHERRVVIELDGGQHSDSGYDAKRDAWLASKGYRVLRFWNSEMLQSQDAVLETIVQTLGITPPSPTLPLKGGGSGSRQTCQPR